MKKTEIVVIGAGIAGLTAAIYLKRANADFVIIEGGFPGGLLNKLKTIENYPSYPSITGSELTIKLMEQIKSLGIEITYGNAQSILKENEGFEVKTDVDSYECKAVIVATGVSQSNDTIPGQEKYAGMGVSYCATCDGNFFKGLDVAVIGNNNIAIEESLYLANLVNKLYLVNPDEELSGDAKLVSNVNKYKNIEVINKSKVDSINGDDFGVTSISVNGKELSVAGVFPYIGKKTTTQILGNLKPDMKGIYVKVDANQQTNIEGLYAAGDIIDKKLRQLVTAANDGAIAAISASQYVKQGK